MRHLRLLSRPALLFLLFLAAAPSAALAEDGTRVTLLYTGNTSGNILPCVT